MNFSGIAAGLSAAYPGMVQGESNLADLDVKQAKAQEALGQLAALAARGNAFKSMFSGAPGGAMAMPPGASSAPAQGQGMQGGQPQQFMGSQGSPGAGPMPQMQPTSQFASGPPGGMPQGAPQQAGGPPTGPGGFPINNSGPGGHLDWRSIVQHLQQSNPGLPPAQLAMAVDQFLPMMTMQSKQEWQQLSMQLRHDLWNDRENERQNNRIELKQMGRGSSMLTGGAPTGTGGETGGEGYPGMGMPTQGGFQNVAQRYTGFGQPAQTIPRGPLSNGRGSSPAERERKVITDDLEQTLGRPPTLEEVYKRQNELKGRGMTATEYKIGQEQRQHRQVDMLIDDAIDDIKKGYGEGLSVTGLSGGAKSFTEVLSNIAGWNDSTLGNEFRQKINILRTQIPKLLAGRSVISKDERERINKIVPGLEPGSTQQITFNDLRYLKKVLRMRAPEGAFSGKEAADDERTRARPEAAQEAPAALKPMTPEAEALRQKAIDAGHPSTDIDKALRARGYDPASTVQKPEGGGGAEPAPAAEGGEGAPAAQQRAAPAPRKRSLKPEDVPTSKWPSTAEGFERRFGRAPASDAELEFYDNGR